MIERYKTMIERDGGAIHRCEDWGRRQLAYPIAKIHKGHYVLLNIEAAANTVAELESSFRFNDAVLRNLILSRKEAVTEMSKLYAAELREQERERERERQREEDMAARQRARDDKNDTSKVQQEKAASESDDSDEVDSPKTVETDQLPEEIEAVAEEPVQEDKPVDESETESSKEKIETETEEEKKE